MAKKLKEYELAGIETIARGICIRNGKILLCRAKGADTTYLPGGHIEFGETGRVALAREVEEEMGLPAKVKDFRGCVENQFLQHGKPHAEINLVYTFTLPRGVDVSSKEKWISFEWCPLKDLASANLLPADFRVLAKAPTATFSA